MEKDIKLLFYYFRVNYLLRKTMTDNRLRLVSEQGYTFEDAVREYSLFSRQNIGYVFQFQKDYRKDAQGGNVSEDPSVKITRHIYALMEETALGMVSQSGYVPLVSYEEFARPESFRRKVNYFKEHMPVNYGLVFWGPNPGFPRPWVSKTESFTTLDLLARHFQSMRETNKVKGPDYRLPEFVRGPLADLSLFWSHHFEKFSKSQRDELEGLLQ